MHEELDKHFDWIWKNASIPASSYLNEEAVGVDNRMYQLGAVNVYNNAEKARKRIIQLLENAKENVSIMGITLRSFFRRGTPNEQEIFDIINKIVKDKKINTTVLLLNPDCDQAKYRAYREQLGVNPGLSFNEYNGDLHRQTLLYVDTNKTIQNIKPLLKPLIENDNLRLYDTAPACFILRIDDTVLTEQYLYGKAIDKENPKDSSPILGKDMALFEYSKSRPPLYKDLKNPMPFDLFIDHFDFVFRQAKPVK